MKYDNLIKSIIPAESSVEPETEVRYAVAYNGSTQEAIRRVLTDLNRQLTELIEQGIK